MDDKKENNEDDLSISSDHQSSSSESISNENHSNIKHSGSDISQERSKLSGKTAEMINLNKPSTSRNMSASPPPSPKNNVKEKKEPIKDKKKILKTSVLPLKVESENKRHTSEEDEDEIIDDIVMSMNPSGSVLAPTPNPYNKQDRIREANIELFKKDLTESNRTRIRFSDSVSVLENEASIITITEHTTHEPDDEENIVFLCGRDTHNIFDRRNVNKEVTNDDTSSDSTSEEDSNVDSEINEVDTHSVFVRKDLRSEISDNTKVLLVKVPDVHTMQGSSSVQSDSSSENEDVCFGHRMNERTSYNFCGEDVENMKIVDNPTHKKNIREKEHIALTNNDNPIVNSISSELSNLNLNEKHESNTVFNNSLKNISVSPKNNTGIKIKITCADCCDKFKSQSEKCLHCESSSDLIEQRQNTSLENHTHCNGSVTLKSGTVMCNSKTSAESKKDEIKRSVTNISINLHALTDSDNSTHCNRPISIDKRKNVKTKIKLLKKIDVYDNIKSSKQTSNISNVTVNKQIVEPLCLNNHSNSNKENFKLSKSLITNSLRKVAVRNDTIDCNHIPNERPKSCNLEQRSKLHILKRPETAPLSTKRDCSAWEQSRLPKYNGFRSEYGLTEKQLQERKRMKDEKIKQRKLKKEEKIAENERKRKENEQTFSAWLAKKNELAKQKRSHTQMYPGFTFRRYSAPTNHLLKNNCFLKKRSSTRLRRQFSVDKLLIDASPQEKRTFRIYLGLGTE